MDRSSLISMQDAWPFPPTRISPGARAGRMGGHGPEAASGGESTLTERSGGGRGKRKRNDSATAGASEDESSKHFTTSSGNDLNDSNVKCLKDNGNSKTEPEANSAISNKPTKHMTQPSEPSKLDYIHVRARRGQATDSHSLAERARREKISERMKILQDLVPGCNKVIGKASVLDEIINYIQALQNQVEFMSMKLEAVNSHMNVTVEGFPPKDFDARTYDASSSLALQPIREYGQEPAADWLHMQVGGAFERVT